MRGKERASYAELELFPIAKKWQRLRINKKLVLSEKALQAMKNIKPHIEKGCLSNIPLGCGTNRNRKDSIGSEEKLLAETS